MSVFKLRSKERKNSREVVFMETETYSSTSRFADLTVSDFGAARVWDYEAA